MVLDVYKKVGFIWIALAIFEISVGVVDFLHYRGGGLFLYRPPDCIQIKYMVLGIINLIIGIYLIKKPEHIIVEIYSYILWLIAYSFLWSTMDLLQKGVFDFTYILIPDYIIIFLIIYTIKSLKQGQGPISNSTKIKHIIGKNWQKVLIETISINLVIYLVTFI